MVSSTPRPHFIPRKDPVPIVQEAGWAPGPVCTGGKSRPHRDSIPDRPAPSQSLYRLSYTAHFILLLSFYLLLDLRDFPHSYRSFARPTLAPVQHVWRLLPSGKSVGAWHQSPTPSSIEIKKRVELCIYFRSGPS